MDTSMIAALFALPVTVVAAFIIHWMTIARIDTAEGRLAQSRGAYLGLSFQLAAYAWFLVWTVNGGAMVWVALGMSASFVGDVFNLQFPSIRKRLGEPLFFGILAFMPAQIAYIAAYLDRVSVAELVERGHLLPLLAVFIIAPAIVFRLKVWNPNRPRRIMYAAFVYGFILSAMAAVAIAAALARGGGWYAVAAGALFFLLSDAVMGDTTVRGRHPANEFQVPWITYLAAQGLIVAGFRLVLPF